MSQTKAVEKIKTHFMSNTGIAKNCAVYEIMWKNMVDPDRPDDRIIRRMRFACRITKATNTHFEYVILIGFPRQQWWNERASMLRYIYIAYLLSDFFFLFVCLFAHVT
jgi:hypothetical protein